MILINRKDLPEANAVCKICGHKYRLCKRCLQLRSLGLESWREYCDCIECYQVYLVLSKDTNDITKEEYEQIKDIQLPVGLEYTDETKKRFKELDNMFNTKCNGKQTDNKLVDGATNVKENKTNEFKKVNYGFEKKKNNKPSYKNKY